MGMLLRRHYKSDEVTVDYGAMKKDELVALAVSRGIMDADKLKKDELIQVLKG